MLHRNTPKLGIGIIVVFVGSNSQSTMLLKGTGAREIGYKNTPEVPPW